MANTELGHVAFYWEREPDHTSDSDDLGMEAAGMPPLVSSSSDEESGDLVAELCLPVSKTDYKGTGARRRLRCNCKGVGRSRCAPPRLVAAAPTTSPRPGRGPRFVG